MACLCMFKQGGEEKNVKTIQEEWLCKGKKINKMIRKWGQENNRKEINLK